MSDNTASPDAHQNLSDAIGLLIGALNEFAMAPSATRSERAAAQYLYERVLNYRGMLRSRPLTKSVEFLTPVGPDLDGPGWYWASGPGGAIDRSDWKASRNWHGPFRSQKAAVEARDQGLPRTKAALNLQQLLASLAKRPEAEEPEAEEAPQ